MLRPHDRQGIGAKGDITFKNKPLIINALLITDDLIYLMYYVRFLSENDKIGACPCFIWKKRSNQNLWYLAEGNRLTLPIAVRRTAAPAPECAGKSALL